MQIIVKHTQASRFADLQLATQYFEWKLLLMTE
jgi:hypothetical protein